MGWNWIVHLARHCRITAITEIGFREHVLSGINQLGVSDRVEFRFVDIGETARRRFWNQGDWRFYHDYRLWQERACRLAAQLLAERPYDLCHQLNMIGFREPGYLWRLPVPFVWGPVGGHEQMPWRFIPALGFKPAMYYLARNVLNSVQSRACPRVRKAARSAAAIIAATPANQAALRRLHGVDCAVIVETGTRRDAIEARANPFDGTRPLRLSWCGKFLAQKALPVALRALAMVKGESQVELDIIGDGREGRKWRRLGERLGVDCNCRWLGAVAHEEALRLIAASDAMLLTSVQEATSTVVMEALSAGVPVVCHDACGFGIVVDGNSGLKIPLMNPARSVRGFADCILRLSRDPALLAGLRRGAAERARAFTWERKAEAVLTIYRSIVARSGQALRSAGASNVDPA